MIEKIIHQLQEIVRDPTGVFTRLKSDERTVFDMLRDDLVVYAAIPAAAGFIGMVFVGQQSNLIQYIRVPFFRGLMWAIVLFVLSIVAVYVMAYLVSRLAENFEGKADETAAFKLVVTSYMPVFALGIVNMLPSLSALNILGLYGIYLFYIGCPILMECPEEKSLPYTVAASLAGIFIAVLVHRIAASALL